jgi:hypothetical protein
VQRTGPQPAFGFIASVITSKAANGYQFKTGQRKTEAVRDKIVSTS